MSKDRTGKSSDAVRTIIDIAVALLLVGSIFVAMFGFTGNWPPLVVIESKSMQHSQSTSYIGTMDTGDLVMSTRIQEASDVVTYLAGERQNHSEFGDFGDVIIYWRDGDTSVTPIIHRAILYLEANGGNSFMAPEIEHLVQGVDYDFSHSGDEWNHITGDFTLHHFGYNDIDLDIPISTIITMMTLRGVPLHDGFVTKGDNNLEVDQRLGVTNTREPIPVDWIVGKAAGEIPWVGIIKLWLTDSLPEDTPSNSIVSIGACIVLVLAIPIASEAYIYWKDKKIKRLEAGKISEANASERDDDEKLP